MVFFKKNAGWLCLELQYFKEKCKSSCWVHRSFFEFFFLIEENKFLTQKDSCSNYLKYFLDDLIMKLLKNLTFSHTKMLNISFINSTIIYFLTGKIQCR